MYFSKEKINITICKLKNLTDFFSWVNIYIQLSPILILKYLNYPNRSEFQ